MNNTLTCDEFLRLFSIPRQLRLPIQEKQLVNHQRNCDACATTLTLLSMIHRYATTLGINPGSVVEMVVQLDAQLMGMNGENLQFQVDDNTPDLIRHQLVKKLTARRNQLVAQFGPN